MISNNDEQFELNGYLRIIDNFQEEKINNKANEIWKYQSYIELVNTFKRTQNRKLFSNNIILILSLFEDLPPDTFHTFRENIDQLSKKDKNIVINILKNEFLHE